MKPNFKSLFLGCFVLLALFAGSARAQEDDSAPVDPKLQKMLDGFKTAKPAGGDAFASAEQQAKNAGVKSEADTCAYTFTSGSGYTYLQWCATVNGNIVEFQSPSGAEQIDQGTIGEGYGVCDVSTDVGYYDYSDDGASGWGSAVLDTHNGTLVKITRTTTDGLWTLIQTLSNSPGSNPGVKVTMQLKNNSSVTKTAFLFRWADVDPGRSAQGDQLFTDDFEESFDSTFSAAWGEVPAGGDNSGAPSYGLMFQNSGVQTPPGAVYARDGYSLNTSVPPAACNPAANFVNGLTNTDGSILYLWAAEIKKAQTITVNGRYFSF